MCNLRFIKESLQSSYSDNFRKLQWYFQKLLQESIPPKTSLKVSIQWVSEINSKFHSDNLQGISVQHLSGISANGMQWISEIKSGIHSDSIQGIGVQHLSGIFAKKSPAFFQFFSLSFVLSIPLAVYLEIFRNSYRYFKQVFHKENHQRFQRRLNRKFLK